MPGTIDDNKRDNLRNIVNPPPRLQLRGTIPAHDKKKTRVRIQGLLKMPEGLNRVGLAAFADFIVRDLKSGIALNTSPEHSQPIPGRGQMNQPFMRRLTARDKDHPVQNRRIAGRLGNRQMSDVKRIKCPAENTDACHYQITGDTTHAARKMVVLDPRAVCTTSQVRICPVPRTTYLYVVRSRSPIGPRACNLSVLIPTSAPKPNS